MWLLLRLRLRLRLRHRDPEEAASNLGVKLPDLTMELRHPLVELLAHAARFGLSRRAQDSGKRGTLWGLGVVCARCGRLRRPAARLSLSPNPRPY